MVRKLLCIQLESIIIYGLVVLKVKGVTGQYLLQVFRFHHCQHRTMVNEGSIPFFSIENFLFSLFICIMLNENMHELKYHSLNNNIRLKLVVNVRIKTTLTQLFALK